MPNASTCVHFGHVASALGNLKCVDKLEINWDWLSKIILSKVINTTYKNRTTLKGALSGLRSITNYEQILPNATNGRVGNSLFCP